MSSNTFSGFLLVVFIHGFKGNDETFQEFPERLQHILSESMQDYKSECIVFPAYETKGDLSAAVARFADWLTTLTVEREVAHGGGAGTSKIVLCGHSMGGLLAADTLLEFIKSRPSEQAPLWPRIIACLAFDTPYNGVHPHVFRNGATKAVQYLDTARTLGGALFGSAVGLGASKASQTPAPPPQPEMKAITASPPATSAWSKWLPAAYAVGGALAAGAAAGGAYYKKQDVASGYSWVTDHMKYVGNLWDETGSKKRLEALIDTEKEQGIIFRTFYTLIPPSPPVHLTTRTFVVLPPRDSPAMQYFTATINSAAEDEIQAHIGMFDPKTEGYYDLGLQTARLIRDATLQRSGRGGWGGTSDFEEDGRDV